MLQKERNTRTEAITKKRGETKHNVSSQVGGRETLHVGEKRQKSYLASS